MKKFFIFLLALAAVAAIVYFLFFYNTAGLPHGNATFVDSPNITRSIALNLFT